MTRWPPVIAVVLLAACSGSPKTPTEAPGQWMAGAKATIQDICGDEADNSNADPQGSVWRNVYSNCALRVSTDLLVHDQTRPADTACADSKPSWCNG